MSVKPILFNTDMVQAILAGRKTVTRRVVKPQPTGDMHHVADGTVHGYWIDGNCQPYRPPYQPGDILYVRETWLQYDCDHIIDGIKYAYRANATLESERERKEYGYKWRPSIHMPKEAARIFLWVTDVRVERLQNIDNDGALAEGCDGRCECPSSGASGSLSCVTRDFSVEKFQSVWDNTIRPAARDKYSWAANPWVWVIEFERCENPEVCL